MTTKVLDEAGVQKLWGATKALVDDKVAEIKEDIQDAADELSSVLGDPTDDQPTDDQPTDTPGVDSGSGGENPGTGSENDNEVTGGSDEGDE